MQNVAVEKLQYYPVTSPARTPARPAPGVRGTDPIGVRDDAGLATRWFSIKADAPVKFTEGVLASFRDQHAVLKAQIGQDLAAGREPRVRFMVLASARPSVFSLGGDLKFFRERIADGDRGGLARYARACIELIHDTVTGFGFPLTTIALVRGTAQGGGFEGALAHNVVVAERQSHMGMPEILFNLFPGMGAYQLLCRRLPPAKAEQLILSGRTYPAEELYEMGLVDVLADEGKGEEAVWEYIRQARTRNHGRDALRRMIRAVDEFRYEDLVKSVDIWVDAAFSLSESDLKMMDFLVRAQQRLSY